MRKAGGSWSGMRKVLEREMLAECLKGRVRYHCSTAVGMDGCRFFEVRLDGRCVQRFSWETVNSWFIENGLVEKPSPMLTTADYWDGFWELMKRYPMESRGAYTDDEFCAALETYRNGDIQASVHSPNPIVRMFALLDRRVGKRTLEKLAPEMEAAPAWLREIYQFRAAGETHGISKAENNPITGV